MIGKIQRLRLREVWKHEALDFTTWLEENIDVLNDALNLNLVSVDREQSAGDFSVDLVGEDNSGNIVVVENQLERSDHDHLGKLITYLTSLEAKIAIWIVSEPRAEHVKAISWLNESSSAQFYLVKVEAIKIEGSDPAPLLTLITGPNEEAIKAGNAKKEMAERYVTRKRFWDALLKKAKERTKLHSGISAGYFHWIGSSVGYPNGINLNYCVRQHDAQVELYIDSDKDSGDGNRAIFDHLFENKESIEQSFGGPLEWMPMESKRACVIRKKVPVGGYKDESQWDEAHEELINAMIALDCSIKSHIKEI
jgi:hypothetical protein